MSDGAFRFSLPKPDSGRAKQAIEGASNRG